MVIWWHAAAWPLSCTPTHAPPTLPPARLLLCAEDLSTRVGCRAVVLDTRLLPHGQLRAVRDCACCESGPSSFVAIGGFDGQQETMDMLVFKARWARQMPFALHPSRTRVRLCVCACAHTYTRAHTFTYQASCVVLLLHRPKHCCCATHSPLLGLPS